MQESKWETLWTEENGGNELTPRTPRNWDKREDDDDDDDERLCRLQGADDL